MKESKNREKEDIIQNIYTLIKDLINNLDFFSSDLFGGYIQHNFALKQWQNKTVAPDLELQIEILNIVIPRFFKDMKEYLKYFSLNMGPPITFFNDRYVIGNDNLKVKNIYEPKELSSLKAQILNDIIR